MFLQAIPDPTAVVENATRFGWLEGVVAFTMIAILVSAILAVRAYWNFQKPLLLEEKNAKIDMMSRISASTESITKLAQSHRDGLTEVADQLQDHSQVALKATQLISASAMEHCNHRHAALIACRGLQEFLKDQQFPEGKEQYLHYVADIEKALLAHHPSEGGRI